MAHGHDRGSSGLGRRQLLAAGITGAALVKLTSGGTASADQALDIQLLQTAASIENALVDFYVTVLGLPLLTSVNSTLKNNVFWTAHNHHIEHAKAFNDAVTKLGGRSQPAANPTLAQMFDGAGLGDLGQISAPGRHTGDRRAAAPTPHIGRYDDASPP
jgi:hypothetical protein